MAASADAYSSDRPRSADRQRSAAERPRTAANKPRGRKPLPAKSIVLEHLVRFGALPALMGVFVRNGRLGALVAVAAVGSACLIGYLERGTQPSAPAPAPVAAVKPVPLPPPRIVANVPAAPAPAPAPAQAASSSSFDDLMAAPQAPAARPKPVFSTRDPAIDRWFMKAYLRCWTPPAPLPQDDPYAAKIRMTYNADGTAAGAPTLVNPPSNPDWRPFADSALKAVAKCGPLQIPAQYQDHYDQWKKMSLYFSPDSAQL